MLTRSLSLWDAALDDERLLRRDSLRQAFTPATATDDLAVGYGYGWRLSGEIQWHSGETRGFRNVIVRYPERRMTIVLLTNRDESEPYRTALTVGTLYLNQ
jgi:CubicO group peptidase (beta-lactamase class C family)